MIGLNTIAIDKKINPHVVILELKNLYEIIPADMSITHRNN